MLLVFVKINFKNESLSWIHTTKNVKFLYDFLPNFSKKVRLFCTMTVDRDMVGGPGVEAISAVCLFQYLVLETVVG